MSTSTETASSPLDVVKLLVAGAILVGGIVAYYYFEQESDLIRVAGVLVALALAVVVALQSLPGRELWRFMQGSRVELRKVIWPNRPEVVQTTLTVMVFVLIFGVFFWLLDMGLLSITRLITGQGG